MKIVIRKRQRLPYARRHVSPVFREIHAGCFEMAVPDRERAVAGGLP